jgi:hypothetical protein
MPEADSFFKYLITLALADNHNLYRFIVVDKNPNMMKSYRALLDPMLCNRRLSPFLDDRGFAGFLSQWKACSELGRGELVGGNVQTI